MVAQTVETDQTESGHGTLPVPTYALYAPSAYSSDGRWQVLTMLDGVDGLAITETRRFSSGPSRFVNGLLMPSPSEELLEYVDSLPAGSVNAPLGWRVLAPDPS